MINSRYDFMSQSAIADVDGDVYPDVLSTNYSNFSISEFPEYKMVSSADISKFWAYMYRNYNISCYDDVLLNMNGIPYIGMLEPGSTLINFRLIDIKNFNNNKRKEVE